MATEWREVASFYTGDPLTLDDQGTGVWTALWEEARRWCLDAPAGRGVTVDGITYMLDGEDALRPVGRTVYGSLGS